MNNIETGKLLLGMNVILAVTNLILALNGHHFFLLLMILNGAAAIYVWKRIEELKNSSPNC